MNNINTAPDVQEETFFVQNVTPGHHFVTDMAIHFQPFEVKDLLSEDPMLLKKSRDIRKSLALGTLVKISKEEADNLLEMEIVLMQQEQRKEASSRDTLVNVDGKQIVADTFDAARAGNVGDKSNLISTAGFANDHSSYAQAFQNMRDAYAENGKTLSAREFGQMTQENPDIVRNYMNRTSSSGVWSGDPGRGRATYAVPSSAEGDSRAPAQNYMSNFNRDNRLAGSNYSNMVVDTAPELPYAEEIIIGDDDSTDAYDAEEARMAQQKGSVRRKKV
jgi:hypothetical protein